VSFPPTNGSNGTHLPIRPAAQRGHYVLAESIAAGPANATSGGWLEGIEVLYLNEYNLLGPLIGAVRSNDRRINMTEGKTGRRPLFWEGLSKEGLQGVPGGRSEGYGCRSLRRAAWRDATVCETLEGARAGRL
jgi:hypothetical protein